MKRLLVMVAVLALVAAACGAPSSGSGEKRSLAYGYETGDSYVYDGTFDLGVDMTAEGGAADELGAMGPMSMAMSAGYVSTYDVSPGPGEGTYAVAVSLDEFAFERFAMSMMGEEMEFDDPAMINAMMNSSDEDLFPAITYIVDDRGTVSDVQVEGMSFDMTGMDPTSSFGGIGQPGRFFGPELPAEAVGVGDVWTTVTEQPFVPGGDEALVMRATHRIVGEEERRGALVLVIETSFTIDDVTLDVMDMIGEIEDPAAIGVTQDDLAAMQMFGDVQMSMSFVDGTGGETVVFAPDAGVVHEHSFDMTVTMRMDMSGVPEMGAGGFAMHMSMEADTTLR